MLKISKSTAKKTTKVEIQMEGKYSEIMLESVMLMKEVMKVSVIRGGYPSYTEAVEALSRNLIRVEHKIPSNDCNECDKEPEPEQGARTQKSEIQANIAKLDKIIEEMENSVSNTKDDKQIITQARQAKTVLYELFKAMFK